LVPYATGTDVPVFTSLPDGANDYSQDKAAEIHDNGLRWVFETFQTDENTLRQSLIDRIGLKGGERVLITGAGAGNDIPYVVRALAGSGQVYLQDIAREMLLTGVSRFRTESADSNVGLYFSVSDATDLPFSDGFFDAAYHFGGINLFPDISKGVSEMSRVVKIGGKIVIGDEGLAPWLLDTELGRMLINNNALYAYSPPLAALPSTARAVKLSWELSNCFYVIEFETSHEGEPVNIDVPHIGKRGGTIRTRYLGALEGIDPDLRDRIYEKAEELGMSRSLFIESAMRASLEKG
jgi:ubiquinone/menaquinone biosynthesis C-methylase UbiE